MFGKSAWQREVEERIRQLEQQATDLKRTEAEGRTQTHRLSQIIKNLGRKLVSRLPVSVESLEKGLTYDLVFSDEISAWKQATQEGIILDIRPFHDYLKGAIPGSFNISFDQLSMRLESLPKNQPLLIVCDTGVRSVAASELLTQKGYSFLYVLKGGMSLYQGELMKPEAPATRTETTKPLEASA